MPTIGQIEQLGPETSGPVIGSGPADGGKPAAIDE